MNAPNFWDNQEAANKLMQDLKFLKGCVEPFKGGLEKANAPHELEEVERPMRPFSAAHVAIDGDE